MRHLFVLSLCLLVAIPGWGQEADTGDDQEASNLEEALAEGDAEVNLRYRFEFVEQDSFEKDANASTLRTTLSYRTKPWANFSLFLEAENVTDIGTEDQYDNRGAGDLWNHVDDRPVVADPEITEVNQSYLRWQNGETNLTGGRQEFNWGDQRYVGAVGWRQNHQSFDAFSAINQSLERVELTYLYIGNVNRIFGDDDRMASHLLTGKIDVGLGDLDLYGLYLDYDNAPAKSTSTLGLQWAGAHELDGGSKILWEAEYATQSDTADNPSSIDADYSYLMLGTSLSEAFSVRLNWEMLGGSVEDGAFQTPLATLHKWNGWADKFLTTPENGLQDLWLDLSGKAGKWGWTVRYHDFSSDSAGIDYGTELDGQISYPLPWGQVLFLKGAVYSADELSDDTTKIWFYTTYKF